MASPLGAAVHFGWKHDGVAARVAAWRATGRVAWLDVASRSLVGTTRVGPEPKGIAIAADSERWKPLAQLLGRIRFLATSQKAWWMW